MVRQQNQILLWWKKDNDEGDQRRTIGKIGAKHTYRQKEVGNTEYQRLGTKTNEKDRVNGDFEILVQGFDRVESWV